MRLHPSLYESTRNRMTNFALCLICGLWLNCEFARVGFAAASTDSSGEPAPRPSLHRGVWKSLSGRWEGEVSLKTEGPPALFGPVQVPLPAEAAASGFRTKLVGEQQQIWYRRKLAVPKEWARQRILLHFEGVDWHAQVWINKNKLGEHKGGYDRFTFDITDSLIPGDEQELLVSVFDPSDAGHQPRGKQERHPKGTFYTSCSGMWQTVWLEPVPEISVESLHLIPDIDAGCLRLVVYGRGETNAVKVDAVALHGKDEVGRVEGLLGSELRVPVPNARLWSPDSPTLYDLKVTLRQDGKLVDTVTSYFGMRKISVAKDSSGQTRLMLNNQPYFQLGLLDHGYWPEGIYTAPSDQSLREDIERIKRLGFNMCRKHVKIEPERWYYWCDRLGLLVWQDMPNAGQTIAKNEAIELQRPAEEAAQFEVELKEMIRERANHPSIVMWILFNQGWGQYDTAKLTQLARKLDPSRPVVGASGWHDLGVGDVRSVHGYTFPDMPQVEDHRALVIGECGGYGVQVDGHVWGPRRNSWGHARLANSQQLTDEYVKLMSRIERTAKGGGVSGAVYTQLTDVETEVTGLYTYDRRVVKVDEERIRAANRSVLAAGSVK